MQTVERTTHKLDAAGQTPGRLASQIAHILQGKDRADYKPNMDMGGIVEVVNCDQLRFTGRNKMIDKTYYRHTGYPGGLKEESLKHLFERDPGEVLRRAVARMLPKNRLQKERIKRLIIK